MHLRNLAVAGATALLSLGLLTVAGPAPAATYAADYGGPIPIADGSPSPVYPAVVPKLGMAGAITDVNVTLRGVNHPVLDDLDIVLQSPSGHAVMLMSDACGTNNPPGPNYHFDQQAPAPLPDNGPCAGGTFQPSSYDPASDFFPPPAPMGPQTSLAAFNGTNPNGTWRLFIRDDLPNGAAGVIAGGYQITITTAPAAIQVPPTESGEGAATPYPHEIVISGQVGKVADVDVTLPGIAHTRPSDLDVLLVGPQGQAVVVLADACGDADVNDVAWTFDDEAMVTMPPMPPCGSGSYAPANHSGPDMFQVPAPAPPHGSALSDFDGTNPNGTWQLYVVDDLSQDAGYITGAPTLDITMDPPPDTTITKHPNQTTTRRKAVFEFTSNESPNVTFQCRLDAGDWKACTSPKTYTNLRFREHTFRVRAIDTAGSKDATPAKWVWRVKRP